MNKQELQKQLRIKEKAIAVLKEKVAELEGLLNIDKQDRQAELRQLVEKTKENYRARLEERETAYKDAI